MTRLGLIYLPYWPPERLPAFAATADAAGADELWLWEDAFASGGISSLATALGLTSRVEVGIGVLPVPLRNVAVTAMELATLSRLFPGRLHVGIGHGVLEWMEQAGVRAASPLTLLREYVLALRGLLSGQTMNTKGDYVRLRDVRLDWPPSPPPPLYVGAVRPRTLALAAEHSDGTILVADSTVTDVAAARSVLDAAGPRRRLTVFTPVGRTAHDLPDAAATVDGVQQRFAAGADTVVLEPRRTDDPTAFARFVLDEVRRLLRTQNR